MMFHPLNSVNGTKRRRTRWVNRSWFPPPVATQTPRRLPRETESCLRPEMDLGLANCRATNSHVRGLQWTLVDIQLLLASKSGR